MDCLGTNSIMRQSSQRMRSRKYSSWRMRIKSLKQVGSRSDPIQRSARSLFYPAQRVAVQGRHAQANGKKQNDGYSRLSEEQLHFCHQGGKG